MHIVLVYRYYNDGLVYYNLTFCTRKISNDRFGFIVMAYYLMSLFRQVRAKTKKGWQALNSCHPS